MISINLLPEEYIEKRIVIPIPLREIATVIFLLLLVVLFFMLKIRGGAANERSDLLKKQKKIAVEFVKAEKLIQEMTREILPKKGFAEKFQKPQAQWDFILNLVSDVIPEEVWLSNVTFSDSPQLSLRFEGFASDREGRSTIGVIGDFSSQIKKTLETRADANRPTFNIETFTEQQELISQPEKVTHFIIELKERNVS